MDDKLHYQHGQMEELHHRDCSAKIFQSDGNKLSTLDIVKSSHSKCLQSQEPNKVKAIQIGVESSESNEVVTKSKHCSQGATEYRFPGVEHDDKGDVAMEQLRNGCDKNFAEQERGVYILSGQLQSIHLNQASSGKILGENGSSKTMPIIHNSSNLSKITYTSIYTSIPTSSSTVISLTSQNANNTRDIDNCKCGKDIYKQLNANVACQNVGETVRVLRTQGKRPNSFLKSQSLEIVQDLPFILYNETDVDEQIFFQLSEIDEDNAHLDHLRNSSDLDECLIRRPQLTNNEYEPKPRGVPNCDDISYTDSVEDGIRTTDKSAAIIRSLSLSSQKTGKALKTQSFESRPIYPNVPYSPYASPYSSPSSNRRRPPLRESRRVSIEQSGSFLQLNQYKLMDQIGQGSYGLVKLAYSEEDSTHYAMKILSKRRLLRQVGLMKRGPKKSTSPLDRVYREIAVLKKLDHPNVVKLVEVLDDPVEDSLYMVFELVKQGEVLSVPTKNPLSEGRAWSVFRDTLLGLEYLHYQRIIHGDIKPGNLLLTECGRVKIADLGVCNEFIGEDAIMTNGSTAGTPAFRAPESLNVGQNIYCGKAADIWALGATLYALVYGNVPFVASSIPVLYEKIKNEELSYPEHPKTSVALRNCIQCMLKKDPVDRITLPELKKHDWVTAVSLHPLPTEEENCRLVQVSDDDINTVVRSIPKLDTLILIKTMLKKHSFGNPFFRGISGRAPQRGGSRLERFIRAGRSNSAPGSYNMIADRHLSGDNILPALSEHSSSNCTNEEFQQI